MAVPRQFIEIVSSVIRLAKGAPQDDMADKVSARSRHMPSQQLATLSAANDQDFKPFLVET